MEASIQSNEIRKDPIAEKLQAASHNILVVVFGLLPIFFIPLPAASLEQSKVLFVVAGIFVALIFFSLSVLRSGKLTFGLSYAFLALWTVVAIAFISGILSGDIRDALIGNGFGVHTAVFTALLALSATVWVFMDVKRESIMRLFMLLIASTLILVVYHIARLVVGPDILSLGVFQGNVSTPIGSWNDLALFLGLTILLSLVTLEQLPLTKYGRILFGVVTAGALAMLAIINFYMLWVVLGLVSLVMLVYSLGRDRLMGNISETSVMNQAQKSMASLILPIVVFIVSALFVVGGTGAGNYLSNLTGISYIEVRPSVSATADIARQVYGENAFLGIGTNRFSDAWRQYKDDAINNTVFWNTNFQAGSGYIPTFFVTNGVLGALVWVLFLGLFVFTGIRMLFMSEVSDRLWYFIGTASFVGAVYIWGMSVVYIPGTAMLLLAALLTGVTFAAGRALGTTKTRTLTLGTNRRTGFLLTLIVMAVITGSVGSLYAAGRNYMSGYMFAHSVLAAQPGATIDDIEAEVVRAFTLSQNDVYARRIAEYQLARMNSLLAVQSPTVEQQQQFQAAIANGVNAGRLAVDQDSTEPENWAVLGNIYSILASAQVDQAAGFAKDALQKALDLDSKNPRRYLELAVLEARTGNLAEAHRLTEEAIAKKSNYGDALFLLAQLDIASGDVDAAIRSTRSIIALDPQNPARYYQLGVLESSRQNVEGAIVAFEQAVLLDPNFANARYFLALAYSEKQRPADAKAQLEKVLELNPGNEQITSLIEQLDTNGSIFIEPPQQNGGAQPVGEQATVSESEGNVTTTKAPDTRLVTPINTPPDQQGEPEPTSDPEPQTNDTVDTENQTDESTVQE